MRTTLDIDTPVLQDLKKLQRTTHQSLSSLASSLLAEALKQRSQVTRGPETGHSLKWQARAMGARVDLQDKDSVYRAMGEG